MPDVVRAPCPVCGRRMRVLRSGRMGHHVGEKTDSSGFRARCDGAGELPGRDAIDPTYLCWQSDFARTAKTIPREWLVSEEDFVGIDPEHHDADVVRLYAGLVEVGYAKGWLS
jgi:hypothetical protein